MILTDEQRAAVEANEQNVLVSAGAGSGKTLVIVERIRYLLSQKKINPKNIVCITFTRNAATELKNRLSDLDTSGLFIGTIHSLAYQLTNKKTEIKLYDDKYDNLYHKELIEKYATSLSYKKWLYYKVLKQKVKNHELDSNELDILSFSERVELDLMNGQALLPLKEIKKLLNVDLTQEEYDDLKNSWKHPTIPDLCRQNGVICYNDLITLAKDYYKKHKKLEYVLVDEFQDIGNFEYEFIRGLEAKNYYFCGDDFQAIYGFKGSNFKIFVSLARSDDFKLYTLTKNFRCDNKIIDLADSIIKQLPSDEVIYKKVVSNTTREGLVENIYYELDSLLKLVSTLSDEDRKNCFILVRGNDQLTNIKNFLKSYDIDTISFSQANMSREDIQEMLNKPFIKLLTIHGAKGLEADTVFLIGNFDLDISDCLERVNKYKEDDIDKYNSFWEERRLFYVGVTRARHNLVIMKTQQGYKRFLDCDPMTTIAHKKIKKSNLKKKSKREDV